MWCETLGWLVKISIHALHEESDYIVLSHQIVKIAISIHALHEESDVTRPLALPPSTISIHALHEESDPS